MTADSWVTKCPSTQYSYSFKLYHPMALWATLLNNPHSKTYPWSSGNNQSDKWGVSYLYEIQDIFRAYNEGSWYGEASTLCSDLLWWIGAHMGLIVLFCAAPSYGCIPYVPGYSFCSSVRSDGCYMLDHVVRVLQRRELENLWSIDCRVMRQKILRGR
jgi:hypothetical protein